jgi:hypothetical protein
MLEVTSLSVCFLQTFLSVPENKIYKRNTIYSEFILSNSGKHPVIKWYKWDDDIKMERREKGCK